MFTDSFGLLSAAAESLPWLPASAPVFVAYLGPNTVLPLASALAASIGIVLVFWRYIVGLVRKVFRAVFKSKEQVSTADQAGSETQTSGQ